MLGESSTEENVDSSTMQGELEKKGSVLTKAWTDLLTFLTKYQADLRNREKAVQIAEEGIRKKLFKEETPLETESEELVKVRENTEGS